MLAMVIIHTGFSYPTRLGRSYVPDPLFRVYLDSIHKAKVSGHGKHILGYPIRKKQGGGSNPPLPFSLSVVCWYVTDL